ncbi:MAG: putative dynein heavy chain, partial [Streblomastix strix]
KSPDERFQTVIQKQMNPKSISIDEMFGCFSELTQEWKEGLLSYFVSDVVKDDSLTKKWIIFDGPVDTLWVESLNTVLDDSKTLCLPNRKRIKLTPTVALLFEVENLDVASPATVSRCGMVYIDPQNFPWRAVVKSWIEALPSNTFNADRKKVLNNYFRNYLENILNLTENMLEMVKQPTLTKVQNVINIMKAYFKPEFGFEPCFGQSAQQSDEEDGIPIMKKDVKQGVKPVNDQTDFEVWTKTIFFYACVWGVGGSLHENARDQFDPIIRKAIEGIFLPNVESVFEVLPDTETRKLAVWEVQEYKYEAEIPFFNILVPTVDTVRYSFLTDLLIDSYLPTMYVGETGVGKSVIAYDLFERTRETKARLPVIINFSAQTSSGRTQIMIESKLLNRRDHFAAPPGQSVVLFI